jgi:hypothetical protein
VRRAGSFSEQWALLFRDYLRAHAEVAAEYAALNDAWPPASGTTAEPTSTPRGRSYGKSCAWPTGGRHQSSWGAIA